MEPCDIGRSLGRIEDCHKLSYTNGKSELLIVTDLDEEIRELLCWRSEIAAEEASTVCFHHKKIFVDRYESSQRYCCDPFDIHPESKKMKSLRPVNLLKAKELKLLTGKDIKPGQKRCPTCVIKEEYIKDARHYEEVEEFKPSSGACDKATRQELAALNAPRIDRLNQSLTDSGFSPLKPHTVSQRDRDSYGKRKRTELQFATTHELTECLDLEEPKLAEPMPDECTGKHMCQDMSRLIGLLKEKMKTSSTARQIQMLTLAPASWTIAQTVKEFQVSEYKVKQARRLLKEKGVLGETEAKQGRTLSKEVEDHVTEFYNSDEYTRLLPGAKDYVSIRDSKGKRQHRQKRLILMNLNELYENYKLKYPGGQLYKICVLPMIRL